MVRHCAEITPILQARMGSTRLPGKVLMWVCGSSMLSHIVKRVAGTSRVPSPKKQFSAALDAPYVPQPRWQPMIVATTINPADDAIESECMRLGIRCFRGSEKDVLSRFYEAATECGAQNIMRVCCDNPLLDPKLLSALAIFYYENSYSYVTNANVPLGMAAEIFTFERLEEAYLYGKKPYHREHVTPFIYENGVDCGSLKHEPDLSHLRFTVDTPEDFSFITEIYENLYEKNPEFGLDEILSMQ